MEKARRKFVNKAVGCAVLPLVAVLLLCLSPKACRYYHEFRVKSEFESHREYYESLVRQIESDKIPPDRVEIYLLPKDRYSGSLSRYVRESGDSHYEALFEGRAVEVETWNGMLTAKFALRVTWFLGLPAECGVAYSSGDSPHVGPEETLERFEKRWWLRWRSLAH